MFGKVNLEEELKALREKESEAMQESIMDSVHQLLQRDDKLDDTIRNMLCCRKNQDPDLVDESLLNEERIFTTSQIRKICVDYRLRFLDSKHFRDEIPYKAISKIKQLEKDTGVLPTKFKIVAPATLFELIDRDKDPLLFWDIGNGKYYLVHKWGKDINAFRKFLVYPFRTFKSITVTIFTVNFVIAMAIPTEMIDSGSTFWSSFPLRMVFFFYILIATCAMTTLVMFAKVKNLNDMDWDNKYFK